MITAIDIPEYALRLAEQASAQRGQTVPQFLGEVIKERLASTPVEHTQTETFTQEEIDRQRAIFEQVMDEDRNILSALAQ